MSLNTDGLTPTAEQTRCIELARTGLDVCVEAGAGAGKTSTIDMIARDLGKPGVFTAFNRGIVEEADAALPPFIKCKTLHSLAFREYGVPMQHRLNGNRIKSDEIGKMLGLRSMTFRTKFGSKHVARGFFGSLAMKSINRFCQSDRDAPSIWDVPIPRAARHDATFMEIFDDIRYTLAPVLDQIWEDLSDPSGKLPYSHSVYLKQAERGGVELPGDVLFVDEAQDLAPVAISICRAQRHMQIIAVGDNSQQINRFTGSVSLLKHMLHSQRARLSESFRFGPPIAGVANELLAKLPTSLRLTGLGGPSVVGPIDDPDVILFRTNAGCVRQAFYEMAEGRSFHVIGGASDVVSFCKAARDLMNGRPVHHPDLVCFVSWAEVVHYADTDEQGGDLLLLVSLIEEYGVDAIIAALDQQVDEDNADTVISTVHKVKGRAWPKVMLGADFPEEIDDDNEEELMLLYVAVTRAKTHLDVSSLAYFATRTEARDFPNRATNEISTIRPALEAAPT